MSVKYFSWIPNPKITGNSEQKIKSDTLDSVIVNSKFMKIRLASDGEQIKKYESEYTIFEFNVKPGVHSFSQPEDIEFPLELAYAYSIDLLENISLNNKFSTLLYLKSPISLVDALFSLDNRVSLPFLVRRPGKTLFSAVYQLTSIFGNLLTSLETVSDQYEDYVENALYTFRENVINPLRQQEESTLPDDLIRVLDRAEDLHSIITNQIFNIRERYRAYSRLLVPLIHFAYIKSDLMSSLSVKHEPNSISYKINTPIELDSASLASFVAKGLED